MSEEQIRLIIVGLAVMDVILAVFLGIAALSPPR